MSFFFVLIFVYILHGYTEYNFDDIPGYVRLIKRGSPGFVEVKGVTFCGWGSNSQIRMTNVPWHEEVYLFSILFC